jgi:hypothetical protein
MNKNKTTAPMKKIDGSSVLDEEKKLIKNIVLHKSLR